MQPFKLGRKKKGPEAIIQESIIAMLRNYEWYVKVAHGNMYQSGFPDLYCTHARYKQRWIEVKNPDKYKFTAAQLTDFPLLTANGTGIWILVAATEKEYKKLFQPPNWYQYLSIWRR